MAETNGRTREQVIKGSTLGAGVILAVALLAMVNYLGWKYYKRFDWTKTRLYSLSEKTENVLASLDRDVDVVIFMDPGDELYDPVREILARYQARSPHIQVRILDPVKNLAEARRMVEQYRIDRENVVVFAVGEDRRVVSASDLADYDFGGMQFGQRPTMTAFKGEHHFTSAILELTEERKPKILFTTGHGESRLDDRSPRGLATAQDLLGRDNFEMEEWASLGQPAVPEGTDLVVIAGPTASFVQPELDALSAYLERGGRVLVLLDPPLSAGGLVDLGLSEWLAGYGVRLGEDIVVDPARSVPFFGAETVFVSTYGDHDMVRTLRQAEVPVLFALARSVGKEEEVSGYEVVELLKTSSEGWGETDLARLQAVAKDDRDTPGPVSLGVAVTTADLRSDTRDEEFEEEELEGEGETGESESDEVQGENGEPGESGPSLRLVVFGDSDFATNAHLANAGNATLLNNAFNWLVERQSLLGIPPKSPEQVRLNLTRTQLNTIYWLVLGALPGLGILIGVTIYFRRRR